MSAIGGRVVVYNGCDVGWKSDGIAEGGRQSVHVKM
jgi:hypothetical protein